MQSSLIKLDDPATVTRIEGQRSVAFFSKKKSARVDDLLIGQLKQVAEQAGDKNVRLCLHDSPGASFHDMVILERRSKYYRVHKRPNKDVTYHMIEGSMAAYMFDEEGRVEEACLLVPGNSFIYRVDADRYRVSIPVSDVVIYHEVSPGPFVGESDSIYPTWAPDGGNHEDAMAYTTKLLEALDSQKGHMGPQGKPSG